MKQLNRSVERNVKRIKASEKKIIFLLDLFVNLNIHVHVI